MANALTTLTRLLIVQHIQEDAGGVTLHFQDGSQGRFTLGDGDRATYLRLARRSQERQHPVGVKFGEGQTIAALMRADNDVPTKLWEENHEGARALFQGHDGVFHLQGDHPERDRLLALLGEAIGLMARVWFISHKPELALLDVMPAGWEVAAAHSSEGAKTVLSTRLRVQEAALEKSEQLAAPMAAEPQRALAVATINAPPQGLELLEEQIDHCLTLAKTLNREQLTGVIDLLRRARNNVVWIIGERQSEET
jgi:hypothetical protein